jgi:hypothetical protein
VTEEVTANVRPAMSPITGTNDSLRMCPSIK